MLNSQYKTALPNGQWKLTDCGPTSSLDVLLITTNLVHPTSDRKPNATPFKLRFVTDPISRAKPSPIKAIIVAINGFS